ncbi:MAG: aminotransferase class III-fold pyridoxal phosphate-dependent enzyme [Planctomycetota bacterium]|jgi:glutamate-1-semialdehyde 2,1-aminomutase
MKLNDYTNSRREFRRALDLLPTGIPGHLGPVQGCAIPIGAYPMFAKRAKGAYFWDLDGNRFIDYMCAYGPNILGYNDPDVEKAVLEQIKLGDCTTSPFAKMIDMAEILVDTVSMADWAFFAKNGGDVTSLALMVAKAATGRRKTILIKGNYHGVAPWTQKLGSPGITEDDVANNLYIEWNNIQQLEKAIQENEGEIACFMSTPYWHPVFCDSVLPGKGYWDKVRKLCTDNGIVLAVDDVRCGFRLNLKGSDFHYGFKADLMCFCKALGNGWNFSALCGVSELKEAVSSLMYTGSYWLSAVPFAAGIATINKLKSIKGDEILKARGKQLTEGLRTVAASHGFDLAISGEPSMWYMRITNDDSLMLHQKWIAECVKRGVFFASHHNLFVNASLSDEDIGQTVNVADEAFSVVAKKRDGK